MEFPGRDWKEARKGRKLLNNVISVNEVMKKEVKGYSTGGEKTENSKKRWNNSPHREAS